MGSIRGTRRGVEVVERPACDVKSMAIAPDGLDPLLLSKAHRAVEAQLFDARHPVHPMGEHALQAAEEVFSIMVPKGGIQANNHAMLLLGESGSGKTTVVEHCVRQLMEKCPSSIVLRAFGRVYTSDLECMHHLSMQLGHRLVVPPGPRASFEDSMHLAIDAFRASFDKASAMVVVLDGLEHFVTRGRQSLLYSLFDEAQKASVNICVVATSPKFDVMDSFEKRIWSRFEMRHTLLHLPNTMEGLAAVLMARLMLRKETCPELPAAFVAKVNRRVEAALVSKRREWLPELGLRHPRWYLQRCGGVWGLLAGQLAPAASEPQAKRRKTAVTSPEDVLIDTLTECQHVVLLALKRLRDRRLSATLAAIRQEVLRLGAAGGGYLMGGGDLCEDALMNLVRLKLVSLAAPGPGGNTAWEFLPCRSDLEGRYDRFVTDLREPEGPRRLPWNPLRDLPTAVQEWGSLQNKTGLA